MATAVQIPLSDYLRTSYRPDLEYIDGNLQEKNMGQYEHSYLQSLLAAWFMNHRSVWKAIPLTEQRIRVSATRVRLPDLCLVPLGPQPDIIVHPPILVVEILSPEDTFLELLARCRDYEEMGVKTIWIIDPKTRTARIGHHGLWTETRQLELPESPISISLDRLFADLDHDRQA